jgi:hypothetical protein
MVNGPSSVVSVLFSFERNHDFRFVPVEFVAPLAKVGRPPGDHVRSQSTSSVSIPDFGEFAFVDVAEYRAEIAAGAYFSIRFNEDAGPWFEAAGWIGGEIKRLFLPE